MAPTDNILQKVKEELGEEPKISVEEDVLVVKSEGEDETIIAVPVKKIQQLIDALEILKVFFVWAFSSSWVFKSKLFCHRISGYSVQ